MREELKHRFDEAIRFKDGGDLESAGEILRLLSQSEPESAAIFAVLGDVCWEMKEFDQAIIAFKRAAALAPRSEAVSLGLFHCLWASGKRSEALDEVRRFTIVSGFGAYDGIIKEINKKLSSGLET